MRLELTTHSWQSKVSTANCKMHNFHRYDSKILYIFIMNEAIVFKELEKVLNIGRGKF